MAGKFETENYRVDILITAFHRSKDPKFCKKQEGNRNQNQRSKRYSQITIPSLLLENQRLCIRTTWQGNL